MAIAVLLSNHKHFRTYEEPIMNQAAAPDHQPAFIKPGLVVMLLAAMLALPAFAEPVAPDADHTDTGFMVHPLWRQDANRMDDAELRRIHGKGMEFTLTQPEQMPAVILWDESGKGRSTGTSQTSVRVSVSGAATNTR